MCVVSYFLKDREPLNAKNDIYDPQPQQQFQHIALFYYVQYLYRFRKQKITTATDRRYEHGRRTCISQSLDLFIGASDPRGRVLSTLNQHDQTCLVLHDQQFMPGLSRTCWNGEMRPGGALLTVGLSECTVLIQKAPADCSGLTLTADGVLHIRSGVWFQRHCV